MERIGLVSIRDKSWKGLMARPEVLNRMGPFLLGPRVLRRIYLQPLKIQVVEIRLPVGKENWSDISSDLQETMWKRIERISHRDQLNELGVTRALSDEAGISCLDGSRGDRFLIMLGLLKIGSALNKMSGSRIVLVSDRALAFSLAARAGEQFRLPLVLQSQQPSSHERMAMRLLREQGIALSLSYFDPKKWRKGDIVIILDEYYARVSIQGAAGIKVLLTDGSTGHAPRLELELGNQGLDPSLGHLAPLLEAFLQGRKNPVISVNDRMSCEDSPDMWDFFLDKGHGGLYNTIKGF